MSFYSIAQFIQEFYPEYYSIETYPKDKCVTIRKVDEPWGVLGNFGRTPIIYKDVMFKNSEQLFQLMKFKDAEPVTAIYQAGNPKYTTKHWEKTHRRADWGQMIVDAMKFCLTQKYQQSEEFRQELGRSRGMFIVEDQDSFSKKSPDTWGVKTQGNCYVGPNLLGRLLMDLRDNGKLEYHLPTDAFAFLQHLPVHVNK